MLKIMNCTAQEFYQICLNRKIVCIGAGKNFFDICDQYGFEKNILYVIDNYKADTAITVNQRKIKVIPLAEAGGEIRECILIITTLKYADELLEQLDRCRKMDDLECYLPHFFRKGQKRDIFPGDRKTSVIPKTIHYIWFGGGSIPEQYLKNIETWKKYCSDYEIVQWNETNYDVTKNLYMYQAYQEGKWGFVPDYARLDVIDEEMIIKMAQAGCIKLFFGLETGSPKIQTAVKKRLDVNKIFSLLDIFAKFNVDITISFIYGFPEEDS